MKGFSEKNSSAFQGLTVRRALTLVKSLQKNKLRTERQIRKVFSQSSEGFNAALAFLIRLGIIRKSGAALELRTEPPTDSALTGKVWLLSLLLRVRNRYRSEVFRYLRKYRMESGELVYRSLVQRRSRESEVRNFLMEMGVVSHDREEDRYILSHEYVSVYASATETRHSVSPESLAKSFASRDEIGLSAEREIIDYEKGRLGPTLAGEVDHVALRNVAAGYDIRSLTVIDENKSIPRYIEVKAVSPSSMCFHWTHNEIRVAQALQESYFLYLLPVSADGGFDLSSLKIITDPYKAVFGPQTEWVIETEVIRCSLRIDSKFANTSTGVLQNV